jgi:hypothetical protein
MNTTKLNTQPYAPNIVRNIDSSPEGLDLAEPNTTIEILEYEENEEEDDEEED